jgi:hypothetical protein
MQIYYLINSFFLYKRFKVEYNLSKLRNGGVRDKVGDIIYPQKNCLEVADPSSDWYVWGSILLKNCIGGYSKRTAPLGSFFMSLFNTFLSFVTLIFLITVLFLHLSNYGLNLFFTLVQNLVICGFLDWNTIFVGKKCPSIKLDIRHLKTSWMKTCSKDCNNFKIEWFLILRSSLDFGIESTILERNIIASEFVKWKKLWNLLFGNFWSSTIWRRISFFKQPLKSVY